jgi:hypothetical protein
MENLLANRHALFGEIVANGDRTKPVTILCRKCPPRKSFVA